MPPKQDAVDLAKSDVAVLCNILMSSPELKLDHKSLAPILGLSSTKNVRLKPYDFEYKSGKIFPIGQEPGGSTNDEDGEPSSAPASAAKPKTPKTPKTSKAGKGTKTPASKKRKLSEAAAESDAAADGADAVLEDEGDDSDVEA
ncbi:hypothetical protein N0V82_005462 [Gnomoniopsis sp. IMI 355080]|nr:hypothetical protein N0V82_005462 [Gnomoniopsis sp. IMI 355080]